MGRSMDQLDEYRHFAHEANDILRILWNDGKLDDNPILKARLAKLLGVKEGEPA